MFVKLTLRTEWNIHMTAMLYFANLLPITEILMDFEFEILFWYTYGFNCC